MSTEAIRSESETTPTATCVSISARELHELLLRMHAAANIAQRRFIDGLRAFSEQKLYLELGFPNITAYAERTFRFKKSQVYEFMRVSEALVTLPAIASAFEQGELSFSFTAELTRVASGETEAEWLEFTRTRRVAVTLAEVKDALRKNRKLPRSGSYGLPGLPRILKLELAPEEHAIVERGLAKIAEEMASGLDGARPEPERVLVYLMDRVLQGAQPWGAAGEGTREGGQAESPYGLTFVCCPECHRAAVETPEGRVEVPLEAVERLTGSAECVEIDPERERPPEAKSDGSAPRKRVPKSERDRPNDVRLRRELRARAGGRCELPTADARQTAAGTRTTSSSAPRAAGQRRGTAPTSASAVTVSSTRAAWSSAAIRSMGSSGRRGRRISSGGCGRSSRRPGRYLRCASSRDDFPDIRKTIPDVRKMRPESSDRSQGTRFSPSRSSAALEGAPSNGRHVPGNA